VLWAGGSATLRAAPCGSSTPLLAVTVPRAQHQVRNWPRYDAGLRRRGDLTLWLDETARHDELAASYLAFIRLAATRLWL
jgi:hypothetical protein